MLTTAVRTVATGPVIWCVLGYPFEAGSMIGGVAACLTVRLWISLSNHQPTFLAWAIDGTVISLSLLFTAAWVMLARPSPFFAVMAGTGFGALGSGIVAIALGWIKSVTSDAAQFPIDHEWPETKDSR